MAVNSKLLYVQVMMYSYVQVMMYLRASHEVLRFIAVLSVICIFVCTCLLCLLSVLCICVCTLSVFVLCLSFDTGLLDLDAGRLARSQNPEGPATGHLDTGFSWFSWVLDANAGMVPIFPSKLPLHASHVALPN